MAAASRYLIEVSPGIINEWEPLDLQRSLAVDLTPEQLAGIYALGETSLTVADFDTQEKRVRVYKWDPHRDMWRMFLFANEPEEEQNEDDTAIVSGFDNSFSLGSLLLRVGDDTDPRNIYERARREVFESNKPPERYVYGLVADEVDPLQINFFTSDSLEMLQGIMSLAGWLGKDWRQYVRYIYEDGVPMVAG